MDLLGPLLRSLLDDSRAALAACGREVGLAHLAPGNSVAWDDCSDCAQGGQLWVRVVSVLPYPQGAQPCDITDLQARVGVGLVRCVHGLSDDGFPTAEQMTADTLAMTADADTLLGAIRAWRPGPSVNRKSLRVEQGLPQGPEGLCGGWEWTLVFRYVPRGGC